ncbi:MAG: DUF5011 domain-containing protein, partial [Sulfurovaceae bacterium]|nr:DUF5011 domain-containing protein [Sulfurovaceae bacterium]
MFIKNTVLISVILGVTSLSFIGCGETDSSDSNDFSMCDEIGYTNSATDSLNVLSGNPVITLQGDRIITIPAGTSKDTILVNDSYQAIDSSDNTDLTNDVKRVDDINPDVAGEYHIKYSVEDSDGNKDIKCRKVIVNGTDSTISTDPNTIYDNSNYDTGN